MPVKRRRNIYMALSIVVSILLVAIQSLMLFTSCTPAETNQIIVDRIVRHYHSTHEYLPDNIYDCSDMSCDVWNQVIAAGINAEIAIGNVEIQSYLKTFKYEDINHAWVLAEVSPHTWLALECTSGRVISEEENSMYYHPYICFQNPKQLHEFNDLSKHIALQEQRYVNALNHYNELVDIYNNCDQEDKYPLSLTLAQAKQQYLAEKEVLSSLLDARDSFAE